MKVTEYHCTGAVDAADKANLYYINSSRAARMERYGHSIAILDWKQNILATFLY